MFREMSFLLPRRNLSDHKHFIREKHNEEKGMGIKHIYFSMIVYKYINIHPICLVREHFVAV